MPVRKKKKNQRVELRHFFHLTTGGSASMQKVSAHQPCLATRLSEYFFFPREPAVFLARFYVQSILEVG